MGARNRPTASYDTDQVMDRLLLFTNSVVGSIVMN